MKGRANSKKTVNKTASASKATAVQSKATSLRRHPRQYRHAPIKQPTWQNPLIEYWSSKRRKKTPKKPRHVPIRVRLEHQILAVLACFSVSIGLWENFRQLWLQQNGFDITEISNTISIGMIGSVICVLFVGKFVRMAKIKNLMLTALAISSLNMFILFLLNGSGWHLVIKICTVIDTITSTLTITSVYPLLTTVMKSNTVYSKRKLVEYIFRDLGILIGAILIGRAIGFIVVGYNTCLLIAMIFSIAASITLWKLQLRFSERAPNSKFSALKFVLKSRLHRNYMIYVFLAGSAFTSVVGLKMLILTDIFNLSAGSATTYLLAVGLLADVVGVLALKFFTPKNDYITLSLKFGTRLLAFLASFFSGNIFLCFLSLTWTLLSSTAYENISDGYYINSVDNRHQLKYNTLKHVVTSSGEAVGMFCCGQMFSLGVRFIFGFSAILIVLQLIFAFYLIYLRRTKKAK